MAQATKRKQCIDCLARYQEENEAWEKRAQQECVDPVDLMWQSLNPAPKLPVRDAPYPGPRCFSDAKAKRKRDRERAADKRVEKIYGLSPLDYDRLYEYQGETCAICRRAKGKVKRLAVDHRHSDGLVRGLLCGPCNQLLGHGRDDPEFFERIIRYLTYPPAQSIGIEAVYVG